MRGRFIVFEGIDGCGKTTQLKKLQTWLADERSFPPQMGLCSATHCPAIHVTKEPGATALGQSLRQILLAPQGVGEPLTDLAELLLYAADRAQHVGQELQPLLAAGTWVLCDRYTDSTVAYQGYGRGLDLKTIAQLNELASGGLTSDLTLWIDLDVETSLARLRARGLADRIEGSDLAFHERLYEGFAALAAQYPDRIVRINGQGSEDQVAQRVQAAVRDRILEPLSQP
jgi:dTMP kinase